MKNPITRTALILLITSICLGACHEQQDGYLPASSISRNGFAINPDALGNTQGQEIKLWGFVDHGNLYGDEGAKRILQEGWSGEGPNAATWRFNLKARAEDKTGQSFPVYVPNDQGRDALLKTFAADARAGRPTKVYVKGKLFAFAAPVNARRFTGLYLKLQSSQSVKIGFPEEN